MQWVDQAGMGLSVSRYYPIEESNVGGTGRAITLTTGESLSSYEHGMMVYFRAIANNTGNVTINVDGIGSRAFLQTNFNTFAQFPTDQIGNGTSILAVYDSRDNRFVWAGGGVGSASKRLVGSASGNVVAVGTNGRISDNVLNPNIARTSGATFTGPVLGPDPTADAHLATKEYVDLNNSGSSANKRIFVIPRSGVSGTQNALTISTGLSLSGLEDGDVFSFVGTITNSGPVTIRVDGNPINPASLRRTNNAGGTETFSGGEIVGNAPVLVMWIAADGRFIWLGGIRGTAGSRNIGDEQGSVAELGSGGRFPDDRLPNDVVYRKGTIFTGPVSGLTPTVDANLATKGYVDLSGGNLSAYAPILDTNVSGTNIIILTTGRSLSIIPDGFLISFNPVNTNTLGVRLEIDGLPNNAFRKSDGVGGSEELELGDLRASQVVFAYFEQSTATWYWVGGYIGTAARRGAGTDEDDLAVLGSGGRFAAARLPNDVVYRTGTTFTGPVSGPTPTVDANLATKLYVDDNAGAGGVEQHYYPVPDAGVSGVNNIVLTTGQSLTDLTDGLVVSFRPPAVNTGNVTINVDSIGASSFRKNDGVGGSVEFAAGELVLFEVVFAVYSENNNRFFWAGGRLGTATRRNTGVSDGDIALLEAGGRFVTGRLPANTVYRSGATFTGATGGITPVADTDFVTKGYADSNYGGSTPPTPTHTSYTATRADASYVAGDFTGAQGNSFTGNRGTVVDWVGAQFAGFARPVSAGVITELYWYADGAGRGNNQIGAWTVETLTLSIAGEDHYVIRSNGAQTFFAGITFVIEVA